MLWVCSKSADEVVLALSLACPLEVCPLACRLVVCPLACPLEVCPLLAPWSFVPTLGAVFCWAGTRFCCTGTIFCCTGITFCCTGTIFCSTGTICRRPGIAVCWTGTAFCCTGEVLIGHQRVCLPGLGRPAERPRVEITGPVGGDSGGSRPTILLSLTPAKLLTP